MPMRLRSTAFVLLLGIILPFLLLTKADTQSAAPDAAAVERGRQTFSSNCSFCHGARGTGTEQAPNLMRSPLVNQDHDGEVLGPFLKQGRPALGMPSFGSLSSGQVSDIAAFLHANLRTMRGRRLSETALIVGDAKAGQAYFNGQGKCNTCHSATGDLAGIGSKMQPLALTTAFLTPPEQPVTARVTLPSGKIVSGTLKYEDEFAIALVDSSGVYHSWERALVKKIELTDPLAAHEELLPRYTDKEIHDLLAYLVTLR